MTPEQYSRARKIRDTLFQIENEFSYLKNEEESLGNGDYYPKEIVIAANEVKRFWLNQQKKKLESEFLEL